MDRNLGERMKMDFEWTETSSEWTETHANGQNHHVSGQNLIRG